MDIENSKATSLHTSQHPVPELQQQESAAATVSCHTAPVVIVRWLENGSVINNEWSVQSLLRRSASGQEYSGKNLKTGDAVSIRLVRIKRSRSSMLGMEMSLHERLAGNEYIERVHAFGQHDGFYYFVGEHLGPTLAELCSANPRKKFSDMTVFLIGIRMVEAVKSLHENGFVHRNVKPSNFAVGSSPDTNGEVHLPRRTTNYKGDSTFASADCLLRRESGRKDDLWSVLYIMIKMSVGRLPWDSVVGTAEVARLKETISSTDLLMGCPNELDHIRKHVSSLNFFSRPDYDGMIKILDDGLLRRGGSRDSKLDWEIATDQ
uniref:Protein kinase domain-containing protein n=1 Tax=Trichuris muris TaxID=70415 RepID=A0A5S6QSS1_TRIMR